MESKKEFQSIRLQTRLILYSTLVILLLMTLVIIVVENRQRDTIQEEAQKRGMAAARNLAAVSTNALLTYNYVVLEQNAEKVALEEDIVYVIIHDKENRVAAYSQHGEKQGTVLTDEVSQKAVTAKESLIQSTFSGAKKVQILDISVPVYIKESQEKWGTIRIGLSLERMAGQILKTRLNLLLLGFLAIFLGALGSIFYARRITRPISKLVETTISAAQGDLDQVIDIHIGDEIGELGKNFNFMIQQIRIHRNELEKRLREITSLKAYTDNILSSMTNGLITIDLKGKIVTVNETADRIFGIKREESIGLPIEQALVFAPSLHKMVIDTLSSEEGIFHSELELRQEERNQWVAASTALLNDGEGKKIGALAVFEDITEIKVLEEKLRQADRLAALGTLSAGLAHEIKNPLSAIKTFVQLLPQKAANPSFMEKFNVTVPREIDRINSLVEDLLELTRTKERPMVNVDVNQLIRQVGDLHGEEIGRKSIIIKEDLDRNIPKALGDPDRLYRVISNIVINSIQAMPGGGILSIRTDHEDSTPPMVKITLGDTGIGMDEETAKNLFNPFFTTKDKGAGLGMALAHKIIEDHRGRIEVQSAKGKGTTFVVRLPVIKTSDCMQP